jgi:hypothetical protein
MRIEVTRVITRVEEIQTRWASSSHRADEKTFRLPARRNKVLVLDLSEEGLSISRLLLPEEIENQRLSTWNTRQSLLVIDQYK